MGDAQGVQEPNKGVLSVQAGAQEKARLVLPLGQAPVVVGFLGILDEEGDDAVAQALLQGDETAALAFVGDEAEIWNNNYYQDIDKNF